MIFFSIIIPVYNVEKYLKECIESVLTQDFYDYEIILIDDGSTDFSGEICNQYSKVDNRIKTIHKKNGGLSSARNIGMSVAKGRYVVFVDSDDLLISGGLKKTYDYLVKLDTIDVCQIGSYVFQDGSKKKKRFFVGPIDRKINSGNEYLKYCLNTQYCPTAWSYIFSSRFLKETKAQFMENVFHEDEEFAINILLKASKIQVIDVEFYLYRIRFGSIMAKKNQIKKAEDLIKISKSLYNKIILLEDFELKRLLLNRLVTFYISAFMEGKFYKKEYLNRIDENFLKQNAYSLKNKIKVKIFSFNKIVFYFIEYMIMKIRGNSL